MSKAGYVPQNAAELYAALGRLSEQGKILAGGTDFVVQAQMGRLNPSEVLYVGEVAELRRITSENGKCVIGAAVTMRELADYMSKRPEFAAIADAACDVGSPQIRNKATVGGNVANASPAGDVPPTLCLLDAQGVVAGPDGVRRTVPVQQLIAAPGRNSLAYNEAITAFVLDEAAWAGWRSAFVKLGFRGRVTVSRIGFTVALRQAADGTIEDARVFVGAISTGPVRMEDAEALMKGRKPDEALAAEVAELLRALLWKITPEKFDRDYKIASARGVVEDTLAKFR